VIESSAASDIRNKFGNEDENERNKQIYTIYEKADLHSNSLRPNNQTVMGPCETRNHTIED